MNHNKFFAERLRKLRKNTGFKTQKAFAEALGVSFNSYMKWEQGRKLPRNEHLKRIIDFTGADLGYFYGDIDKKNYDLQFICDYTGLSEKAVEMLHFLASGQMETHKENIEILNFILETQFKYYEPRELADQDAIDEYLPGEEEIEDSSSDEREWIIPPMVSDNTDNILYLIRDCLSFESVFKKNDEDMYIEFPDMNTSRVKIKDLNMMYAEHYYSQLKQALEKLREKKVFYKWKNGSIKPYKDRP